MASKAAQLAIELTESGAADVVGGMDKVTASAKQMGETTESAGKQAGRGLDATASGADEVASKGSQAAGALSGLGGLIGGPFGAAMATGGVGLQAMADSGDLLNAALENSVVSTVRTKAATVAKTVADKASAAATKATTVAQKALNLAQRASPIGLIITGVLLLIGGLILLYRHSARFRAIVQAAMSVAKAGVDKAGDAFKALGSVVQRIMSVVARVVGTYVHIYVAAFQLGFKLAKAAWDAIERAVTSVVGTITGKVGDIKTKLSGVFSWVKTTGVAAFHALTAPIQTIVDAVQHLLDLIGKIHLPHVDLTPWNRGGATFSRSGTGTAASTAPPVVINMTVNPAPGTTTGTAQQAAQAMMNAIDQRLTSLNRAPVFSR